MRLGKQPYTAESGLKVPQFDEELREMSESERDVSGCLGLLAGACAIPDLWAGGVVPRSILFEQR